MAVLGHRACTYRLLEALARCGIHYSSLALYIDYTKLPILSTIASILLHLDSSIIYCSLSLFPRPDIYMYYASSAARLGVWWLAPMMEREWCQRDN